MIRWQYLDPAPAEPGRLYDLPEVLGAERWAWAGDCNRRRAEFFYDGFEFWRQLRSGERRVVPHFDAPASGWWHKPGCNCRLCQPQSQDSLGELAGRGAHG